MPKVVITIPAYNEEHTISKTLEEIQEVMSKTMYDWEIVIVDDGSTDKTYNIGRRYATVVKHKRNMGLIETFRTEMKTCLFLKADIIVHTDADNQYPATYIPQLIQKIMDGNDLVLGSRFIKKNYSGSKMKRFGNIMFSKVFSGLLKTKITDTTTGFRAFTKEVAEIDLINSFTYTQEQLIRATKLNMKVCEISITTNKTRKSKLFKNSFTYATKAWINIFRIYRDFAPLMFFGRIGLGFLTLGFLLGLYIVFMIITTGSPGGIPRVILSMSLLLTGVQIGLFGFLADMRK